MICFYCGPEVYHDELCDCGNCRAHCTCIQAVAIDGVGPEAPVVTNEQGGKQSSSPYSLIKSFPCRGVLEVAKVVKTGLERYAPDNWRKIPRVDHLNHAIAHIFAHGAGDTQDDHLAHAACRLLMALETQ
jgi:hypothetical protein